MAAALQRIEQCLAHLLAALDSCEAAAITQASEALAAAVAQLRSSVVVPGTEARMKAELGAMLDQLKAAAMRVNLHANANRQQIDRMAALRGVHPTKLAISY